MGTITEMDTNNIETIRENEAILAERAQGRVYDVTNEFLETIALDENGNPQHNEDGQHYAIRSYVAIREGEDAPEYHGLPVATVGYELVKVNDEGDETVDGQTVMMRAPLNVAVAMANSIIEAKQTYDNQLFDERVKLAKRTVGKELGLTPEETDNLSNVELLERVFTDVSGKFSI